MQIEDEAAADPVAVESGSWIVQKLRALTLVSILAGMGALYWVLFFMGDYGHGDRVYLLLDSYSSFFYSCSIVSVALVVFLATFDVAYWKGPFWFVGQFLIATTVVGFMLTALTFTSTFPAASICVYLVVCPIVLYVLKLTVLSGMSANSFLFWTAIGLLLVSKPITMPPPKRRDALLQ